MDTTNKLLHAFTLPKPESKDKPGVTTSKPNHAKVDPISTGMLFQTMGAAAGFGTIIAVGLEYLRKASLVVLSGAPDGQFATAQDTLVNQLTILIGEIKGLSQAGAKLEMDQLVADIKSKVKAPQGAVTGDETPAEQGEGGVALKPSEAIPVDSLPKDPAELEKVLSQMLANLKTGKGN